MSSLKDWFRKKTPELPPRYKDSQFLGQGGMGIVFRAFDSVLGRSVAIKCLPDEMARDRVRLMRFKREAMAASSLNHPNIIVVHDFVEWRKRHFLVMELVEGATLVDALGQGRLKDELVTSIAFQVCSGLEAMHTAGIVHRDLKPGNIMIRPEGLVKIMDFGIATFRQAPGSRRASVPGLTKSGAIVGTPAYMSPEQVRGEEVDERSDVFAFGCILYEMLTGTRAVTGEEVHQMVYSVLEGRVDPPSQRNPDRRSGWDGVVMRALSKDRAQRWPSIAELRQSIEALAAAVPSLETPPPPRRNADEFREIIYVDRRRLSFYLEQLDAWELEGGALNWDPARAGGAVPRHPSEGERVAQLHGALSRRGVIARSRAEGSEMSTRPGQMFFEETVRASRVVVPPLLERGLRGVSLWIAWWEGGVGEKQVERRQGPLYLIEDFDGADGRSQNISGYSALLMLADQVEHTTLAQRFSTSDAQRFAHAPFEFLERMGAQIGAERRVRVLYRVRASFFSLDSQPNQQLQTIGYPIVVAEGGDGEDG